MPYLAEFFLATYLTGFTQHISCLHYTTRRVGMAYCHRVYTTFHRVPTTYLCITPHMMYLTIFSARTSSCSHYISHRVSTTYLIVFTVHILLFMHCNPLHTTYLAMFIYISPHSHYISHRVHTIYLTMLFLHNSPNYVSHSFRNTNGTEISLPVSSC